MAGQGKQNKCCREAEEKKEKDPWVPGTRMTFRTCERNVMWWGFKSSAEGVRKCAGSGRPRG